MLVGIVCWWCAEQFLSGGGVCMLGGSVRDKARAGYEGREQKKTGNDRQGGGVRQEQDTSKKEILQGCRQKKK